VPAGYGDTPSNSELREAARWEGKQKSILVSEKLNSCYFVYKLFRGSRRGRRAAAGSGLVRRTKLGDITTLVWERRRGLFQVAGIPLVAPGNESGMRDDRHCDPSVPTGGPSKRRGSRLGAVDGRLRASDSPTSVCRAASADHAGRTRLPRQNRRETFPGCKPLKSHETRKESRSASAHR
jgi:hypothetical protein